MILAFNTVVGGYAVARVVCLVASPVFHDSSIFAAIIVWGWVNNPCA